MGFVALVALHEQSELTFGKTAVVAWINEELRIMRFADVLRAVQIQEDIQRALAGVVFAVLGFVFAYMPRAQ